MKILGFTLFILIVGALAYSYFPRTTNLGSPQTPARTHSADSKRLADIIQENEILKNEIRTLANENQNLLAIINTYKQTSSAPAAPISPDDQPGQAEQKFFDDIQAERLAEQHAHELTEYLKNFGSNSEQDFNRDLTQKFDAEPVDFSWAQSHQSKLGQLFATRENLSKFVPEGIICKTTRCQIRIPISSIEESNQVMEGLSQALAESPDLRESSILTLPDTASGFVDFYIARDKNVALHQ